MWPRHQLAAYSPIPVSAMAHAAFSGLGFGADPRAAMIDLLRREYSASGVVLCGSGTQALQLAIAMAMRRFGTAPTVALPGFSCFDVASAAVGANARVTCYDIDPTTLSPDLESLERALNTGARVVVVAPLYGVPVPWDEIERMAERYGAVLIEDAAQGHGASWQGRALGTLGSISTLSFGRGKGWTGGEGGALLVRGGVQSELDALPESGVTREAKTTAALAVQWMLGRPALYGIPRSVRGLGLGETQYHAPVTPRSTSRAVAAGALKSFDASRAEARTRRANAEAILRAIAQHDGFDAIQVGKEATPGYLRLPILLHDGAERNLNMRDALSLGVTPSYPMALSDLPALRDRLTGPIERSTGASTLVRHLITLPTHSRVTELDRARIVGLFSDSSRVRTAGHVASRARDP
jgi:perosamine synthetase